MTSDMLDRSEVWKACCKKYDPDTLLIVRDYILREWYQGLAVSFDTYCQIVVLQKQLKALVKKYEPLIDLKHIVFIEEGSKL